MINCQCSCNSQIFSLFFMNFFPIFNSFYTSSCILVKIFLVFFAQFCVRNGKFPALRTICHENVWLARKNKEEIGIFSFKVGEKVVTFGQNIYLEFSQQQWLRNESSVTATLSNYFEYCIISLLQMLDIRYYTIREQDD